MSEANPYAQHPGFVAPSCPIRYTVTPRDAWGNIHGAGFGCHYTGGHCLPDAQCASKVQKLTDEGFLAVLAADTQEISHETRT